MSAVIEHDVPWQHAPLQQVSGWQVGVEQFGVPVLAVHSAFFMSSVHV
jgi:hypothetical protein